MIKLIKNSSKDREALANLNGKWAEKTDNDEDFSDLIVKKPWGHEYLLHEFPDISVWGLHINKDAATSKHCHLYKKTILIVISGKIAFSTLNEQINLSKGDCVVIDKGVFHSSKSLSNEAIIIELESPSRKSDLVRLFDMYGRELKGYEPRSEMTNNLNEFRRINKVLGNPSGVGIDFVELKVENFRDLSLLKNKSSSKLGSQLGILMEGDIFDGKNNLKLNKGDIFLIENDHLNHFVFNTPVQILKIEIPAEFD